MPSRHYIIYNMCSMCFVCIMYTVYIICALCIPHNKHNIMCFVHIMFMVCTLCIYIYTIGIQSWFSFCCISAVIFSTSAINVFLCGVEYGVMMLPPCVFMWCGIWCDDATSMCFYVVRNMV